MEKTRRSYWLRNRRTKTFKVQKDGKLELLFQSIRPDRKLANLTTTQVGKLYRKILPFSQAGLPQLDVGQSKPNLMSKLQPKICENVLHFNFTSVNIQTSLQLNVKLTYLKKKQLGLALWEKTRRSFW